MSSVSDIAVQRPAELAEIEMRCQKIAAAEIDHRPMPRLAVVVAIGLDHAHIFALHALADVRPDHAQKHRPVHPRQCKSCPCEVGRCHRDSQQRNEQNVEKTCPYKIAKMPTRLQQLQSLSSCTPLRNVKHALDLGF